MFKIGRYRIAFGRTLWVQPRAPTTVRHFLCFWVLKEARLQDVDRKPQFPPGTGMEQEGRSYRYYKAGKIVEVNKVDKKPRWELGTRFQNSLGPWRYARAGEKLQNGTLVEPALASRILDTGEFPAGKTLGELIYGGVKATPRVDKQGRGVLGWPEVDVPKDHCFWLREVPPGAEFKKEAK